MFTVALYVPAAAGGALLLCQRRDAPAVLSVSVSQPAVPVYRALAVIRHVPSPLLLIVSSCAAGAGPDDECQRGATAIVAAN
jgi:hypothetical protein